MTGLALDHVEAAIQEVTKARGALLRATSVQVRASDEKDRLKAVAFAWFKSHRAQIPHEGIQQVDVFYQTILDATARDAARSTYSTALQSAKEELIALRRELTSGATSTPRTVEAHPAFAGLASDPAMQAILNRRWTEVQSCMSVGANLAATVMMGGLMESLLLARINFSTNKPALYTAKAAPKDRQGKTLPLSDWKLTAMVDVAHEVSWISKSAKDLGNVLRDFRNYVHPHKEHTDRIEISVDDAAMFWEVCKAITRQLLASVGKNP